MRPLLIAVCVAPMAAAQEEVEAAELCSATFASDADCQVEASGGPPAMVLKAGSATTACT